MASNFTLVEITSNNIMPYVAWQCNCLNFCLPLFMAFLTFVIPALSSVLKA